MSGYASSTSTSTSIVQSTSQALSSRILSTTPNAPGTPTSKSIATQPKVPEVKPSPGSFRHPQLSEVIRRQSKNRLTERHIRTAVINLAVLVLSISFGDSAQKYLSLLLDLTPIPASSEIISGAIILLRILFIANIVLCLRPIFFYNKPTTYDDIPLTPSQRKLLGLPPSSVTSVATPATAGSSLFITPPRYKRRLSSSSASPSSQLVGSTDRRSISANYSTSPQSTSRYTLGFSPSPNTSMSTYRRTASGSPYSPAGSIAGSPLFHKAVHNRDRSDRSIPDLSFDVSSRTSTLGLTGSPLGRSQSVKEGGHSRSPVRRREESEREKKTPLQKGVNYKWLYDKGLGLS